MKIAKTKSIFREGNKIFWKLSSVTPQYVYIYNIIDHSADFIVCSFMENSIGLKGLISYANKGFFEKTCGICLIPHIVIIRQKYLSLFAEVVAMMTLL